MNTNLNLLDVNGIEPAIDHSENTWVLDLCGKDIGPQYLDLSDCV
jgi:hypothetical protein